jgi:hypothetical protein
LTILLFGQNRPLTIEMEDLDASILAILGRCGDRSGLRGGIAFAAARASKCQLGFRPSRFTGCRAARAPGATLIGMSFTAAGAQQAFLATESGYTGKIAANSTCAGIATVSPSSANGPVAVFTLTAVAAGNCEVTVLDSSNKSAGVMVTVTTIVGGIN